jgi:protein phosphatase
VLGPDKVRGHAQRSVLNRCLGLSMFVHPELIQLEARPDDVLILCSDGVWAVIQDDEFARLTTQTTTLRALSQDLINLALDRHSDDNVSVVAIGVCALMATAPQEAKPGRSLRLPRWFGGRAPRTMELR